AEQVVGNESAHQPVEGTALLLLVGARELHDIVLDLHPDAGDELGGEGALGALHGNGVAVLPDLDALRQLDRFLSNSRHGKRSPYQTWQRTSPPTPLLMASCPASTPLE